MAMASSMRIWVLTYDLPRSGGRVWALASDLARRNDVEILTLLNGDAEPQEVVDGVTVTRLDVLPWPDRAGLWTRARARSVRSVWRWAQRDAPVTLVRVIVAQVDQRLPRLRPLPRPAIAARAASLARAPADRLAYWAAVRRLAAAGPPDAYHGAGPGPRVLASLLAREARRAPARP